MTNPRVITGKAKGRRLLLVPGDSTRPITDRVKEALFNIIGEDIREATFLDLFGGTGSVGIEALSRGASYARFIELNRAAVAVLKANLAHTRLEQLADVWHIDAFAVLRQKPDRNFDYVFIAPPQYKEMWLKALRELDTNPAWLSEDGWIIVQIHPIEYRNPELKNFIEFDQRQYGSTMLLFFKRIEEPKNLTSPLATITP